MEVLVKVTVPSRYQRIVGEVEIISLQSEADACFSGHLVITQLAGKMKAYFGFMAADEFERQYGFQLT